MKGNIAEEWWTSAVCCLSAQYAWFSLARQRLVREIHADTSKIRSVEGLRRASWYQTERNGLSAGYDIIFTMLSFVFLAVLLSLWRSALSL